MFMWCFGPPCCNLGFYQAVKQNCRFGASYYDLGLRRLKGTVGLGQVVMTWV